MIEALLAEAAADGWLVNNLYQLDSGRWRCNFRRADYFTAFATADTADGAIRDALNLLDSAEYHEPAPICGGIDHSPSTLESFRQRMQKARVTLVERR